VKLNPSQPCQEEAASNTSLVALTQVQYISLKCILNVAIKSPSYPRIRCRRFVQLLPSATSSDLEKPRMSRSTSNRRLFSSTGLLLLLLNLHIANSCICLLIKNFKAELQTCGGASDISGRCADGLQCLKTCLPCKTVGDRGLPCIFPFKYEDAYGNWTYNTCTTKDSDDGQPWCATKVDAQGYVVDNAWGDCLDGCPGTRIECDDDYFSIQEGECIDVSVPGSIPNWFGAPTVKLEPPEKDLFEAPVCKNKGAAVRLYDNTCRCDRGETAVDFDLEGTPRGNCTGLEDDAQDNLDKVWCFLENIRDPATPENGCYSDTTWSERDGRYWSSLACREDPDIGRRGSLSKGKKATITHGLAGTTRQSSQTSQSEERRSFTSRPTTTTTTSSPSNIPENSRPSAFEEPAGLVEDYYYFSEKEEQEEEQFSDPFTNDPSSFLFVPGIQESRKEGEKGSSESNNFGVARSRPEEEFGRKIESSSAVEQQQGRFQPQSLNNPGISFNEDGESNLFDVLSQLDL